MSWSKGATQSLSVIHAYRDTPSEPLLCAGGFRVRDHQRLLSEARGTRPKVHGPNQQFYLPEPFFLTPFPLF